MVTLAHHQCGCDEDEGASGEFEPFLDVLQACGASDAGCAQQIVGEESSAEQGDPAEQAPSESIEPNQQSAPSDTRQNEGRHERKTNGGEYRAPCQTQGAGHGRIGPPVQPVPHRLLALESEGLDALRVQKDVQVELAQGRET
jgi:hypothetical protein